MGLLGAAAFFAGVVDAIAGGGGLLTLPSLLAVGIPPHFALGTNKGGSMFGSGAALLRFARSGLVRRERAKVAFTLGIMGAWMGASLVMLLKPETLKPVVLVLLVGVALFFVLRPPSRVEPSQVPHPREVFRTGAIAIALGVYDGFFGPGTGTFLILAFASLLGDSLRAASANAKVVNFASNIGAAILFAVRGLVLWKVALPMAAAQFCGGWLGAHLAIKGGDRAVRAVVLVVVCALVVKVGRDVYLSQ